VTNIQRALLKAGLVDKKKINEYNRKKYLKRKKKEAKKENGR
jgi:hypothetical protein